MRPATGFHAQCGRASGNSRLTRSPARDISDSLPAAYNGFMSLSETTLLQATDAGLYCAAGDFYVDPWRPVDRAVVTHAHADHACAGCGRYLASRDGLTVLRRRLGETAEITTLPHGETIELDGVRVSLHPAGHILGSVQVRVEHRGRGLGGLGRLQGRARRHVRAVRGRPLPRVHLRVDVRAAHLSLAGAGGRSSTRSTPGGAPTRPRAGRACCSPTRWANRSGSWAAWRARRSARADLHPRRRRVDDRPPIARRESACRRQPMSRRPGRRPTGPDR